MSDTLEQRVDALERALTDGRTTDGNGLPQAAELEARLDELEATVETVDDRVRELEAAVQALRGFAGGVDAVDEAVERRANAAIARVERLEAELRETTDGGRAAGAESGRDDGDTAGPQSVRDGTNGRDADRPRRDGERPTDGVANGASAPNADGEPGRRVGGPGTDAGRNDGRHRAAAGRRAEAGDRSASTLAAAAADTARTELLSGPDASAEGAAEAAETTDATLADRIRRLL